MVSRRRLALTARRTDPFTSFGRALSHKSAQQRGYGSAPPAVCEGYLTLESWSLLVTIQSALGAF